MPGPDLLKIFPSLAGRYKITSPATPDYNCIAWSAGDSARWWQPGPGYYWPDPSIQDLTVDVFVSAFVALGYEECDSAAHEPGMEKVAIYSDASGIPTHMARQLDDGKWTSKLGNLQDIIHDTLAQLEGPDYGIPARFLRRARAKAKTSP